MMAGLMSLAAVVSRLIGFTTHPTRQADKKTNKT
jgi:hypothetical protein